MKNRAFRFNIYLWALAACALAACETTGPSAGKSGAKSSSKGSKEEATLLRVHLEASGKLPDRTLLASVYRDKTLLVSVEKTPFLHEGHLEKVTLVDLPQGHAIKLQYDREGTWLLENASTSFRGKRIAIVCDFGVQRWLAAPVLSQRITDGQIMFLPDASREEAERIVRGLNNVLRELKKMK